MNAIAHPVEGEIWKPAYGLIGRYEVSNHGRVRNQRTGRHPKLVKCDRGYLWLKASNGRYAANVSVARLVCSTFNEPPTPDRNDVDHIDRVRDNNVPANLRFVSRKENLGNRVVAFGEKHHNSRLTADLVKEIRSSSESNKDIASRLSVASRTIRDVRNNISWRHVQ